MTASRSSLLPISRLIVNANEEYGVRFFFDRKTVRASLRFRYGAVLLPSAAPAMSLLVCEDVSRILFFLLPSAFPVWVSGCRNFRFGFFCCFWGFSCG